MLRRRAFLGTCAGLAVAIGARTASVFPSRPNILWLTSEDMSTNLGCYGDPYAKTPQLDALAEEGVRYTAAFATAPVCSPARSCIITGVHAASLGTQHLRSVVPKPARIRCFTEYLREAGYYCSNNQKEDYQFVTPEAAWDESSRTAHWRGRKPGQPFFSVFNFMTTHQSRTRYVGADLEAANAALPAELRHRPADAPVPHYYPDTPLVRENLAAYHTQVTLMDIEAGEILRQLEEDGLAEDTIVFYYSDHGAGLPRGKRWLHMSGTRVPFIVRFPERYADWAPGPRGSTTDRLISFEDLAPTVLSLAGLEIPEYMQGSAFLGPKEGAPRNFVFATRDRVDEVVQCSRMVIDGRYQYIRNFLPHRPRMPRTWYSEPSPIRQEIRRLAALGELEGEAAWLAETSLPTEEIYDVQQDPEQREMLRGPGLEARHTQAHLSQVLYDWMLARRDTGILPESEILARCGDRPPYVVFREMDPEDYKRILDMAWRVGKFFIDKEPLVAGLTDADSGVRFWAATGLAVLRDQSAGTREALTRTLEDPSPAVRTAAAEALCYVGGEEEGLPALLQVISDESYFAQLEAAYALNNVAWRAAEPSEALRAALRAVSAREDQEGTQFLNWAVSHMRDFLQ